MRKPSASSSAPTLPSPQRHPFVYSQIAITCLLVVRELFRLPYRQRERLARSLMQCLGLDLPVREYATLAKRAARLGAALEVRRRWPRIQGHGNCTGPPLARQRGHPWGAGHGAETVEGAYGVSSPESGGDGRFSARGDVRRSVEEPAVCHRADGNSSAVRDIDEILNRFTRLGFRGLSGYSQRTAPQPSREAVSSPRILMVQGE